MYILQMGTPVHLHIGRLKKKTKHHLEKNCAACVCSQCCPEESFKYLCCLLVSHTCSRTGEKLDLARS